LNIAPCPCLREAAGEELFFHLVGHEHPELLVGPELNREQLIERQDADARVARFDLGAQPPARIWLNPCTDQALHVATLRTLDHRWR